MLVAHQNRVVGWRATQRVQTRSSPGSGVPSLGGVVLLDVASVTVRLCGELDLAGAAAAHSLLRKAARSAATVILDLRGLSFMDGAGLNTVIAADARLRRAGGRLIIVHGPPQVQRLFELTGMTERLELVTDPADAIAEPEMPSLPRRSPQSVLRPSAA